MNLTPKTVILLCLLPFIYSGPIKPVEDPEVPKFDLPGNVWPTEYSLDLTVYLDKLADKKAFFDGHVEIDLEVSEETDTLSLNVADNIVIKNAVLLKTSEGPTEPPTNPPTDPTEPPTDPTEPPTDPTEPPTDPTEPPTDPTDPPTDPTETPPEGGDNDNGGNGNNDEGPGNGGTNKNSKNGKAARLVPVDDENLLADGEPAYNKETQIIKYSLKTDVKLEKGETYVLKLEFTGQHRDDMNGFYRSSYNGTDNEIHRLVTTQFESTAARSAFPCFDEPRFKAPYTIKVKVGTSFVKDKGYHVLSNTPLIEPTTEEGDFTIFEFEKTPMNIASYLVAFIVSDFKGSEKAVNFNGDKPFKTWGQARYIDNNEDELSQQAGPAVLNIMNELTGIEFAFRKVDQVGIPDFSAGAMENWGLTTYRERMLFFNNETNSESVKQSTVGVTAHELAHQWFGDLVTLHRWDDIWLNEGFADFFEYHASALIKVDGLDTSTWGYLEQFVTDELQGGAFATDGLPSSRPLTSVASDPSVIEGNFDNIAYSKGGSVIRMWNHILGDTIFYDGLNRYLTQNAGENGQPEELLGAFEEATNAAAEGDRPTLPDGVTVSEAFKNWHLEAGYPVLNVTFISNNTYEISQERFLWKEDETGTRDKSKWFIPLTYSTSEKIQFEKTSPVAWVIENAETTSLVVGPEDQEKPDWLIVNNRETGYYRVNYDLDNWLALGNILLTNHTIIDPINRAQIIDDALSLARSTQKEYLDYSIALPLTNYLKNEKEYVPWSAASNGFNFLNTKLSSDATYSFFTKHVLSAIEPRYTELRLQVDPEKDSHLDRLLRILIATWACKLNHQQCVADAQQLYTDDAIPADVKSIVVCTAVRHGSAPVYTEVWEKYINADNNLDQTIYLSALGCTNDEALLNKTLAETIKADSIFRNQDLSAAFSAVYNGNPENVRVALAFLNDHLEDIANTYGGMNPLGGLLTGLANKVIAENDIAALNATLERILTSNNPKVQLALTSVPLARDVVTGTQHWREEKQESITNWLKDTYENTEPPVEGAASITISIVTIVTCLALLFSH